MFSSFDSLNTPGVKVWDYSKTAATTPGPSRIALEDDCAPVHVFLTGGTTNGITVSLPLNSVSGKTITLRNDRFGASLQLVSILDSTQSALNPYGLGQGATITFISVPQVSGYIGVNAVGPVTWVALQGTSSLYSTNALGAVLSGDTNHAISKYATVCGGYTNTASSTWAFVGGGSSNTASGQQSVIVGGNANSASAQYSTIAGGNTNAASNQYAFIGGGANNTASGSFSTLGGGQGNIVNQSYSASLGGAYSTTRSILGIHTFAPCAVPITTASGVSQTSFLILGQATIDATPIVLTSNGGAAGTTNQLILPNNSAYYVKGSVIANVTSAGNTKAWTFECAVKRGANTGTTAIVGAVSTNIIAQDAGASGWTIAVAADTTRGGLSVTATGQAATTIRWVCKLESTEVTY